MDPFSRLIPETRAFLTELSANNNRDWFAENKARYEAELKSPAKMLMDQFASEIRKDQGLELTPKLFRPHRDLRFSKDKTPYHEHLHMLWTINLPEQQNPALFFGIAPGYVSFGAGVMAFDKPVIIKWRDALDGDFGRELQTGLETTAQQGFQLRDPELKRVPSPFDQNHPLADLLRRKGLVLWRDLDTSEYATPLAALRTGFDQVFPVLENLRTVL